jgi:hypothetical protein
MSKNNGEIPKLIPLTDSKAAQRGKDGLRIISQRVGNMVVPLILGNCAVKPEEFAATLSTKLLDNQHNVPKLEITAPIIEQNIIPKKDK